MSTWTRGGLWFLAAVFGLCIATPALAGWPAPDQMKDVRSIAEKLVKWSGKLKEEYQGKWPGDSDFLNRADRFCNRCQHLVNIVNVAIDKGEGGRHTQSAYGEVLETWKSVYTASGAHRTDDWKERNEINKQIDKLKSYYQ